MAMTMMMVRSGQTKASLATQSGGVSRRRAPRSNTNYQVRPWGNKLCRRPGHPSAKGADSTSAHCRMSNSRLHAPSFPQSALLALLQSRSTKQRTGRTHWLEGVSWHRATGEPLGHYEGLWDYSSPICMEVICWLGVCCRRLNAVVRGTTHYSYSCNHAAWGGAVLLLKVQGACL